MASFSVIESAGTGYRLVWLERGYILRLAAVPCLIKIVCFLAISSLGWEQNFVRQALIMLPSYFADGWMLSHIVRLAFFEQRWPFRPTGNTDADMEVLQDRALGIMRGTLTFVVIKFLLAGIAGVTYMAGQAGMQMEDEEVGLGVFVLMMASFAFFFWAFRLLWLYIPAAINYPLRRFLRDLGGYAASWNLIGVWLIAFLPLFFIIGQLLATIGASIAAQEGANFGMQLSAIFLHMVMDTGVGILATAGIAFGVKQYLSPGPGKRA